MGDTMVELITPKCPSCGADIQLQPGQTSTICAYCGSEYMVVDQPQAAALASSGDELEKKKLALQLAQRDLQVMQSQSNLLMAQIDRIEHPSRTARKGGAMLVYIFGIMAVFMTALLGWLFYVLQIYYIYGLTKTTCPLLMIIVIGVSIAFMFVTKVATDISAKRKYDQGLADPAYPKMVADYNALQPKLQAAQADYNMKEQELRDFVK